MISDTFVDLVERGAITNLRNEIDAGTTIAGALSDTLRLCSWADRNPALEVRSLSYTHDPAVLARLQTLHAINSVVAVDLTGQVNSESAARSYVGTVGGQGAFARAAVNAAHGRSIIAFASTARSGSTSRIVHRLFGGVASSARKRRSGGDRARRGRSPRRDLAATHGTAPRDRRSAPSRRAAAARRDR